MILQGVSLLEAVLAARRAVDGNFIERVGSMVGIFRKEWNQYFKSMTGYIFIAVFWVISGAYFLLGNLIPQNGDIKDFFYSIFSALLFIIPILTMRIFSEERKMKTDELLLTAPVSLTAIILGKFLATLAVFLLGLALTLAFPVILAVWGSFEPLVTLGNYFGIILLASSFIAIGLFVSVLTESQLVAAIFTYGILLLLYLVDSLGALARSAFGAAVASFLSLTGHYTEFTYGIFNPANVVYYLAVTALFLFFSVYALENRRLS